jgi:hypothetical protein
MDDVEVFSALSPFSYFCGAEKNEMLHLKRMCISIRTMNYRPSSTLLLLGELSPYKLYFLSTITSNKTRPLLSISHVPV